MTATAGTDVLALPYPSTLPPQAPFMRRALKHPRAMHYNRLIALAVLVNLSLAVFAFTREHWWTGHLTAIATTAQVNLALAVIVRQQYVINAVATIATRAPATWPLRIRWALGKYYHLGGLHVGAALSGTAWYLLLVLATTSAAMRGNGSISPAVVAVSYALATLFIVMASLAHPRLRASGHDRFELSHRFLGWASLVLVWLNTVLLACGHHSNGAWLRAMFNAPVTWLLVATTTATLWPWLLLRRVPIEVAKPSNHAVIAHFDHGVVPAIGSARAISRHPLFGWHYFANVPAAPGASGYRMVVSRAGDWTGAFVDDPPDHVWVRGIPALGVATARRLFSKVLFVATGSGIGPMLGHLLARETPSRLVWITRTPRSTYGDLVDEILAAQPDATIWNTDERGKPDVLRLTYREFLESGAEAVIVIANRKVTWDVVHGFERRGIPAFGPIWDS